MQSLNWYIRRIKGMSPNEILWRVKSLLRDYADGYRVKLKLYPDQKASHSVYISKNWKRGFEAIKANINQSGEKNNIPHIETWKESLIQRATKICEHKFTYFDLVDVDHGNPVDWLSDHSSQIKTPLKYVQKIDYRDFKKSGDCKLVWEPNRHHQLVILGRAYFLTKNEKYAQEIVDQINSWINQNPFGIGMNWRSPLELGVRLINWIWAIDLIRDSEVLNDEFLTRFVHKVYLHCWDVTRKYSMGSSANNHLVGEVAGVFIATSYIRDMPNAVKWRNEAKEILEREIIAQSFEDGCTCEHAFGYQIFVIQFYLYCGLAALNSDNKFSDRYWARLEKMLEFMSLLSEGGDIPKIGDADDGYVLDLASNGRSLTPLLAIGAILFNRKDFKILSYGDIEALYWCKGMEGVQAYQGIPLDNMNQDLKSCSFENSGYYLLQSGIKNTKDRLSILFDCAELGYGSIAAHGHADALSFTLRVGGIDVLVDPGTYDYFTYPEWRNYFRSTKSHNTIGIDDKDQSEMQGPFLWGKRAQARLIDWLPKDDGGLVKGQHDGYKYLDNPLIHTRSIELKGNSNEIEILDELETQGKHSVSMYYHIGKDCKIDGIRGNVININVGDESIVNIILDEKLKINIIHGNENDKLGWISDGYHKRISSSTIVAESVIVKNTQFSTRISIK